MTKISVIVPVYNVENDVARCIRSVLDQTYTDFELLLVNDGSTDGSGEICREFAEKDNRIRYFVKENGGLASARNYGLDRATGEFLCCVDSDDYVDSGCLSFCIDKIEETGADIVLCGYLMENGKTVREIAAAPALLTGETVNSAMVELKNKNLIDTAWNKLYRMSFLRTSGVRFAEGEIFEDTDFNLRLLKSAPVIAVTDRCFYHYILHMGSITRKYNPEKLETIKRRAVLLKEVTDGIDGYCDYYYIKSVFSSFIDMFLSLPHGEIRRKIVEEIGTDGFQNAAAGSCFAGKKAAVLIRAAKSGDAGHIYRLCRVFYVLKYKMQGLFMKVRV